jgi:hypothetical protein
MIYLQLSHAGMDHIRSSLLQSATNVMNTMRGSGDNLTSRGASSKCLEARQLPLEVSSYIRGECVFTSRAPLHAARGRPGEHD